jgi:hypothetical protein
VNGSEVETRQSQTDPFSEPSLELSESEKMDLMAGDDSPYAKAIKKLMRKEITEARQEAIECDPSDEKKQRALMTVAHAMDKFYKNVLGKIVFEKTSHFAEVKQKLAEEELKDQEKLSEVILFNQTH